MRRAVRAGTRRGVPAALSFIIGTAKTLPYTPRGRVGQVSTCSGLQPGHERESASVMHRQNRRIARTAALRQHQLQIAVRRIRRQLEVHLIQTHQRRCQANKRDGATHVPVNVQLRESVGCARFSAPGDGCPLATGLVTIGPIPDTKNTTNSPGTAGDASVTRLPSCGDAHAMIPPLANAAMPSASAA